jgi:tRNA pseudouridine38-40 synthase
MQNYLLLLEYDGTRYSGWQKQPGVRTIQETVESSIQKIFGYPVKVVAAGRTDKGVHAIAQAVSFCACRTIDRPLVRASLNAVLPDDVSAVSIHEVSREFNARFSARGKAYQYRIWNKPFRSVWMQNVSWNIRSPLNISSMKKAAAYLTGKHNFSAFDASGGTQVNKIVDLKEIRITRRKGIVTLRFEADRFLYKMVRNITGTLVDVGLGKRTPGEFESILESRKRSTAGPTAPAHGLFLEKVIY